MSAAYYRGSDGLLHRAKNVHIDGGLARPVVEPLTVDRNGVYTPDPGVDGYNPVNVDIPSDKKPEESYDRTYTANGDYPITPTPGSVISDGSIKVQVPPTPGVEKTVKISANGRQEFPADPGTLISKLIADVQVPTGGDVSPYTRVVTHKITKSSTSYTIPADERAGLNTVLIIAGSGSGSFKFCILTPFSTYSGYKVMYGAYSDTTWSNEFGYNGDGEITLSDTGMISTANANVIQLYSK